MHALSHEAAKEHIIQLGIILMIRKLKTLRILKILKTLGSVSAAFRRSTKSSNAPVSSITHIDSKKGRVFESNVQIQRTKLITNGKIWFAVLSSNISITKFVMPIKDSLNKGKYLQLEVLELWKQKLSCSFNVLLKCLLFLSFQLRCQQFDKLLNVCNELLLVHGRLLLESQSGKKNRFRSSLGKI